jgi:hemerythrin-like domain-containing protein
MRPLEEYCAEHDVVAKVLAAFGAFLVSVEHEAAIEREDLALFVTFFRDFADLGHHEKEEGILIPAMVRSGCSWDDGPVERVRRDHQHERYLMSSLRQAALQRDAWSKEARRRIVNVGREYVDFMRAHIRLEEQELFPTGERCLPEASRAEVRDKARRFDEEWDERGERAWLLRLADELVARHRPRQETG